jgi:hypothetical protein
VIRIWLDGPPPGGVRVRITSRVVPAGDEEQTEVAGSVEDAARIVGQWLERFVTQA